MKVIAWIPIQNELSGRETKVVLVRPGVGYLLVQRFDRWVRRDRKVFASPYCNTKHMTSLETIVV